jgi:hypothetical protein
MMGWYLLKSLKPNDDICILGYRGDGKARAVRVVSVKGNLLNVRCLLRSTPESPVYRAYRMRVIDGIMPLVSH